MKHKAKIDKYNCKYLRKYRQEHREQCRGYVRKWRAKPENKRKEAKYQKEWRKKNMGVCVARLRNKRHLRRSTGTGVNNGQWGEILNKYNYRCAYCGVHEVVLVVLGEVMTQDHVIAVINGGEHSVNSVVPACAGCNSKKGIKLNWTPKIFRKVG